MQSSKSDRALRWGGAAALVTFSLLCIGTTLLVENSWEKKEQLNLFDRVMFSSSFVENWFYDARSSRFYKHKNKSPNLVILDINDETLNKVGRWPWTRSVHGKILDRLSAYGARVVAFDMVFPEPEKGEADGIFAKSIQKFVEGGERRAVILGYDLTQNEDEVATAAPDDLIFSVLTGSPKPDDPMLGPRWINKYNFVSPTLMTGFTNLGYISALPDADGVFRHAKVVAELHIGDGKTEQVGFYPMLGLAAFQAFYNDNKAGLNTEFQASAQTSDYSLLVKSPNGERRYNLSAAGEMKLRYFGGHESFVTVNAAEVLADEDPSNNAVMKNNFAGKVVLFGSSAFGAHDLRHLPTDPLSPGMYLHANLFHALDQDFMFVSDYLSAAWSVLLAVFAGSVVLLLARLRDPLWESLGAIGLSGVLFAADWFYFAPNGYFIRLFFVLFATLSPYAWMTFLSVFREAQEKKKIKDAFSRYVAPEIVKEMLSNPDKLKVGGEKKEITMLFSDVRDFTTISERLTPQELSSLLNIYMGKMTDILFETGGTLDKYIGDAMVGFWGAPVDVPDHAYHAVRGAKQMLEALPAINQEFERRKFPRINVGIGLNTGEASVGNMGSDKIFQYTALGDNMNLASRLESLTKYYGVNLMISEFTLEKLGAKKSEFRIRPLDLVQVKGKSKAVKIYEVIPNWNPLAKEDALLAKYVDAYENLYLKRRFADAIAIFDEILKYYPEDKATKKLKTEAEELVKNPPGDEWDGVTVMTSK